MYRLCIIVLAFAALSSFAANTVSTARACDGCPGENAFYLKSVWNCPGVTDPITCENTTCDCSVGNHATEQVAAISAICGFDPPAATNNGDGTWTIVLEDTMSPFCERDCDTDVETRVCDDQSCVQGISIVSTACERVTIGP